MSTGWELLLALLGWGLFIIVGIIVVMIIAIIAAAGVKWLVTLFVPKSEEMLFDILQEAQNHAVRKYPRGPLFEEKYDAFMEGVLWAKGVWNKDGGSQ